MSNTSRESTRSAVDLSLPDARGLESTKELHGHAMNAPIGVMTDDADEQLSLGAVQQGAQGYLVKGRRTAACWCDPCSTPSRDTGCSAS